MCARISLCEIPCLQGILKLNKLQVYCRVSRIHLEYPMEYAADMPLAHESAGRVNPQAVLFFLQSFIRLDAFAIPCNI
jgi:hypothetical protein